MSATGLHAQSVGDQRIEQLINSINIIDDKLQLSINLGIGAVGYAEVGGVIVDGSLDGAKISEAMLLAYQNAVADVLAYDYATATTANQLFIQEHTAAMNSLSLAVDALSDATNVLLTATSVADIAAEADTRPEQVALQDMLQTEEYTISADEVATYNEALAAVEHYAQQAGAFLAASQDTALTASIDTYALNNNIMIGAYSAFTYTQSVDEFVILWDEVGQGTGWQGYLTTEMKTAEDVYGAGQYILQYGSPSSQM